MVDRTVDDTASDPVEVEVDGKATRRTERGGARRAGERRSALGAAPCRPDPGPPCRLPRVRRDVLRRHRPHTAAAPAPGLAADRNRGRLGRRPAKPRDRGVPRHPRRRRPQAHAGGVVVRRGLRRTGPPPDLADDRDRHRGRRSRRRQRRVGRRGLAAGRLRDRRARSAPPGPRPVHRADAARQRVAGACHLSRVRAGRRPRRLGSARAVPGHAADLRGPLRLGAHLRARRARQPCGGRHRGRRPAGDHVPVRAVRGARRARPRRTCCSGRGATCAASGRTTNSGCACCSTATETTTRSPTSPPAATRPRSSPGPASRRSRSGSSPASAWRAATRSGTRRRGRARSRPGSTRPGTTAGSPP